jgi:RNA polymerase sigma-70 factor (ECF subfamily)
VLEAIYAAYGSGWDDVAGANPRRKGLAVEAIDLGRLLLQLMPAAPEAQGLLALMLYCEARRGARRSAASGYVPLSEQDVTLWSKPMIEEADGLMVAAGQAGRIGRFQLEAAIQSAHARRAATGATDWESIALLYEGLVHLAPTIGALVGRVAAVFEARGAAAGWALLEALPAEAIKTYQPYWALAAHLLRRWRGGTRRQPPTAARSGSARTRPRGSFWRGRRVPIEISAILRHLPWCAWPVGRA